MENKIPELELSYFGVQAYWGVRKPHPGGFKATQELIELCHIDEDKYALDVGCGLGITPHYIAKNHGCKVVGIDISEEMIDKAKERTKKKHIKGGVEFRVADMQALPFEDNTFDIVIGESVAAFLGDKQKGINECIRVTKPGGYVGFNEVTWIETPPPAELAEYISRITGAKLKSSDGWEGLLEGTGLKDIKVRTYEINAMRQFVDEIKYIGVRDFVRGWYKFLSLCIKSTAFREYLKEAWPPKSIFKNYYQYLGYGIYVGRK